MGITMVRYFFIVAGFLALMGSDLLALRGKRRAATVLGYVGYLGWAAVLVAMAFGTGRGTDASRGDGSFLWRGAGLALSVLWASLLVWSVFLEIPYRRRRESIPEGCAVTSGTYAICRHPGFWWLSFLALSLVLFRMDADLLVSAAGIILFDFFLVLFQDLYIFTNVFSGYSTYKKETPFLLPRKRWLRGCR
jgi:protein-S-isoprenylcysteine O-methyltransferase Ste14